ncbi:hypothetical protein QCB44_04330 [Thiomicrorhabdus sp. zzn3]|nr:hypothetical protein [Thiomicrorhabdus sp. zzn3]MDG6777930.1 hypothetical protein [Thiomicrorhabdus sp. zzn3]
MNLDNGSPFSHTNNQQACQVSNTTRALELDSYRYFLPKTVIMLDFSLGM